MKYGGPSFSRNGEVEVGVARQKNFIGLYILRTELMNAHKDQFNGRGSTTMVESMLRGTV